MKDMGSLKSAPPVTLVRTYADGRVEGISIISLIFSIYKFLIMHYTLAFVILFDSNRRTSSRMHLRTNSEDASDWQRCWKHEFIYS